MKGQRGSEMQVKTESMGKEATEKNKKVPKCRTKGLQEVELGKTSSSSPLLPFFNK